MLRRALSFDRKKKPSADDATAPSNGAETARPRTGSHEPVIVSMRRSLSFGRRESLPTNWRRARDDQNEVYYYHVLSKETTYTKPKPLPDGWREKLDAETGTLYYWHVRSARCRGRGRATPTSAPSSSARPTRSSATPPTSRQRRRRGHPRRRRRRAARASARR